MVTFLKKKNYSLNTKQPCFSRDLSLARTTTERDSPISVEMGEKIRNTPDSLSINFPPELKGSPIYPRIGRYPPAISTLRSWNSFRSSPGGEQREKQGWWRQFSAACLSPVSSCKVSRRGDGVGSPPTSSSSIAPIAAKQSGPGWRKRSIPKQ